MFVRIFCMFLMTFIAFGVYGQQNYRYGLGYRQGLLLAHHRDLADYYGGLLPKAVEFNWLWETDGSEEWHRVWNYPDIGINAGWIDLGHPDLGEAFYSTVFLQKYIGDRDSDLQFSFKIAPGISYSTKTYQLEDNENNTFVSTKINMVMEGNLLAHYRFSPKLHTYGGVVFTHYSNGGVKLPNSGYNIPSVTLGMIYTPAGTLSDRNETPVEKITRRIRLHTMYAGSFKAVDEQTNDLGFAWTLSGYGHWRLNHRSALTGGMDIFYNSTIPERVGDPDASAYRVAIMGGHDLIAGPTSMLLQVGYYVYRPEDVDKSFYWRIGAKYQINEHVFAGLFLKAHMGRADLLEWGIGYRF